MEQIQASMTAGDGTALQAFLRSQRQLQKLDALAILAALLPAVVLLVRSWPPSMPTVAMLLAAIGFAGWRLRATLQRRRRCGPLRHALVEGRKQLTRGRLTAIDAVQPGYLAYRLVGGALTLHPLTTPLDLPETTTRMRITGLQHVLTDRDVVLHWLSFGPERGVLLQVEYPALPAVQRHDMPIDDAVLQRASWRGRELLGVLAIVFPVLLLIVLGPGGFSWPLVLQTLAIGGIALVVIAACLALWRRRVAHRQSRVSVLRGSVTEVLGARISSGRHVRHDTWYRVGAMLVCPGAALDGVAAVGSLVRIEVLHGEGTAGNDTLAAFVVEAGGSVPMVDVPLR